MADQEGQVGRWGLSYRLLPSMELLVVWRNSIHATMFVDMCVIDTGARQSRAQGYALIAGAGGNLCCLVDGVTYYLRPV